MSKPRDESFTLCHEKQGRRNVQRKREHSREERQKKVFTEFNGTGTVGGGCIKAKHLNRFFELKVTAANSTIHPISNAHQ